MKTLEQWLQERVFTKENKGEDDFLVCLLGYVNYPFGVKVSRDEAYQKIIDEIAGEMRKYLDQLSCEPPPVERDGLKIPLITGNAKWGIAAINKEDLIDIIQYLDWQAAQIAFLSQEKSVQEYYQSGQRSRDEEIAKLKEDHKKEIAGLKWDLTYNREQTDWSKDLDRMLGGVE